MMWCRGAMQAVANRRRVSALKVAGTLSPVLVRAIIGTGREGSGSQSMLWVKRCLAWLLRGNTIFQLCVCSVCVYVYAISYRSRLLSTLHMYFFPFLRHARLCAPKTSGPDPVKRSGTAACNQFDVLLALC